MTEIRSNYILTLSLRRRVVGGVNDVEEKVRVVVVVGILFTFYLGEGKDIVLVSFCSLVIALFSKALRWWEEGLKGDY